MTNVTFLPKVEGKRTFEFEIALKTRSKEVAFPFLGQLLNYNFLMFFFRAIIELLLFQRWQKGWAWPLEWQKTNWSCFSALLDLLQLKAGASKHRSIFPEPFFLPIFTSFFPFPRSKWRGMRLWRRFCSMDSCARGPSTTRTSRGPAQRRGPAEGGLRWEATTPW